MAQRMEISGLTPCITVINAGILQVFPETIHARNQAAEHFLQRLHRLWFQLSQQCGDIRTQGDVRILVIL